jgi:hypothetical protein
MRQSTYLIILWLSLAAGCVSPPTTNELEKLSNSDSMPLTDLKFLARRVDFDKVPVDTLLVARYPFVNTGEKDLIITEIVPDCTCTGYTLDKKRISPGDTGTILLKYSTKDKFGNAKVYATIAANTPTRLYSLEIAASIKTQDKK